MKASGSYASLVRGVSQQVPHLRGPGQHTEQVNLLPDPVHGLTRRHGSRWTAERNLSLSPANIAAYTADTDTWRTFEYSNAGNEFVVLCRRAARPGGSDLPPMLVYNRTTGVFLTYSRNVTDAQLDLLEAGGISAITAIGKYVFMAGNTTVAAASSSDLWAAGSNQQETVMWIRGGAYGRTFKVTATRTDNVQFTFEYKTPNSSYGGILDTSTVPPFAADPAGGTSTDTEAAYLTAANAYTHTLNFATWAPTTLTAKKGTTSMTNVHPSAPTTNLEFAWAGTGAGTVVFHSSNGNALDVTLTYTHTKVITNPNYAKTVTDLTNAYNSAVTAWIGTAAEAIQPQAIAEQLRLAAVAAGLTGGTLIGSTVYWSNVKTIAVHDSGDGSLIRGVANEVTSLDQVSEIHIIGKVVKVRARESAEVFYLKAVAKDPTFTSGYHEVTWVEGPGTEHTITSALVFATVVGTTVHVASSAAGLTTIAGGTHPTYSKNTAGDINSSPLPFFIGKTISYLGVFQDRLLIGAGAVLRCSKVGDYLNFFRTSVLTVPADDPLEMLSQGSEDDTLRYSVIYDKDLVVFGDKRQYVVSGRSALTPTAPNMAVMSSHADAATTPPIAVGGIMFYAKKGEVSSSVHQIQPGINVESPDSFLISSQLDKYIDGSVIELSQHAKPAVLFARATGMRSSIFTFHYLDTQGEGRKQDAWSRWDFNDDLGPIIGMSSTANGLLIYSLRITHSAVWVVADLCPLTADLSAKPYLDSWRAWATIAANTGSMRTTTTGDIRVAFDNSSEWQFLGDDLVNSVALQALYPSATGLVGGYDQASYVVPTNPVVRDRNDVAVTTGQLTITALLVAISKSSGFTTDITTRAGTETKLYNGRQIGDPANIIGRTPIATLKQSIPVGRAADAYTLTIRARDWLPFTLTAVEWVGQWFNRTQRM